MFDDDYSDTEVEQEQQQDDENIPQKRPVIEIVLDKTYKKLEAGKFTEFGQPIGLNLMQVRLKT